MGFSWLCNLKEMTSNHLELFFHNEKSIDIKVFVQKYQKHNHHPPPFPLKREEIYGNMWGYNFHYLYFIQMKCRHSQFIVMNIHNFCNDLNYQRCNQIKNNQININ